MLVFAPFHQAQILLHHLPQYGQRPVRIQTDRMPVRAPDASLLDREPERRHRCERRREQLLHRRLRRVVLPQNLRPPLGQKAAAVGHLGVISLVHPEPTSVRKWPHSRQGRVEDEVRRKDRMKDFGHAATLDKSLVLSSKNDPDTGGTGHPAPSALRTSP
jgi:hypothetical protein